MLPSSHAKDSKTSPKIHISITLLSCPLLIFPCLSMLFNNLGMKTIHSFFHFPYFLFTPILSFLAFLCMNSIASKGPKDSNTKYYFASNILVTLFIEKVPKTSLKLMGFSSWARTKTSLTRCWTSSRRCFENDSSLFLLNKCFMQILLMGFQ